MRFSLRTLLLVLTLAGPYVGWLCWCRYHIFTAGDFWLDWTVAIVWGTLVAIATALSLIVVIGGCLLVSPLYDILWLRNHRRRNANRWLDDHRWRLP